MGRLTVTSDLSLENYGYRTVFEICPRTTRAYIAVVVAAGSFMVVQSFVQLYLHNIGWSWTILALLTLVSGSATVNLPSLPATVSVSETFVFTSVLLFGPQLAL